MTKNLEFKSITKTSTEIKSNKSYENLGNVFLAVYSVAVWAGICYKVSSEFGAKHIIGNTLLGGMFGFYNWVHALNADEDDDQGIGSDGIEGISSSSD